jgi:hypothetical protein
MIGRNRKILHDWVNQERVVEITKIVKNGTKIAVGIKMSETTNLYIDGSYINF